MANITIGALTTGVQTVTSTGAVTPTAGLDISGITGDWTVFFQVSSLTSGKKAVIQLETSVNGFTGTAAVDAVDVQGAVTVACDKVYSIRKYEAPSAPFGTANGVARINVTSIDSATSLKIRSWVTY